jgi:hypothetical protein
MAQKVGQDRPPEQRLDAWVGLLCGAKTLAQSHVTLKVDPAVQRAVGRQGCADHSTIARTRHACPADHVAPPERLWGCDLQRDGRTPRHPCHAAWWWVDAEVTPWPLGPKAEGRERAGRGRHRRKTGRQTRRVSASDSRESRHDTLRRGKAAAVPALKAALIELEAQWGGTRPLRARIVIRLDGGCGSTAVLQGLLRRGYQVVAQISPRGRGRPLRPQGGPWHPTASEGREIAAVVAPRRGCRPTRPGGIRTPKETGGDQHAVLVPTGLDLPPAAVAATEDQRALSEAPCCPDKPGVGLVTRRQPQWEAQPLGWLVARLAHHLRRRSPRWLSRVPATRWRWRGYGVVRRLPEVGPGPGVMRWRRGAMVPIRVIPRHPLVKPLQQSFAALFRGRVRVWGLR